MKKKDKIYYLNYSEKPYKIVSEFDTYSVIHSESDYDDYFSVVPKSRLMGEEDTAVYKKKQELKELESKKAEKVKEIQDKAIKTLVGRIKINTIFNSSLSTADNMISLEIVKELEEIIKDKT